MSEISSFFLIFTVQRGSSLDAEIPTPALSPRSSQNEPFLLFYLAPMGRNSGAWIPTWVDPSPFRSPASVNHEINFEHVHSCFAIRLARNQLDVLGSWNANREGKEGAGGEKKEEPTSGKRGKGRAVEDGGSVHELGARTAEDGRARADLAGAASLRSGDGVRPARRVRRGRNPPKERGREGPQWRKRCVRREPR